MTTLIRKEDGKFTSLHITLDSLVEVERLSEILRLGEDSEYYKESNTDVESNIIKECEKLSEESLSTTPPY